jgi:hypothetical protein
LLRTLNVSLIGAEFFWSAGENSLFPPGRELAANGQISRAKSAPPAPQQADFR